jgi:hypothetical protein
MVFALLIWHCSFCCGFVASAVVLGLLLWFWHCCCGLGAAALVFVLMYHCCGILLLLCWHCCGNGGIDADVAFVSCLCYVMVWHRPCCYIGMVMAFVL